MMPSLFGEITEHTRELNDIIKTNSSLLEPRILSNWLSYFVLIQKALKEKEIEKHKEYAKKLPAYREQLVSAIKDIMNNKLIPKYRKIVGETVPLLE